MAGGDEIVAELNAQAKYARFRVGTKDAHSPYAHWVATAKAPQFTPILGHPDMDMRWKVHAVPGTRGFELIPGLPPVSDYDYFVWKGVELDMHPYGACYHDHAHKLSTGVIEFLRTHKIKLVIIGGLALDYCLKTTVLELLEANFKVVVNMAATRGIAIETSKAAIKAMEKAGALFVDAAVNLTNFVDRS